MSASHASVSGCTVRYDQIKTNLDCHEWQAWFRGTIDDEMQRRRAHISDRQRGYVVYTKGK